MISHRSLLAGAVLWSLAAVPVLAQPPSPLPPKEYDVQLRYRIRAGRNERLAQYFALIKHLEKVGFHKNEGPGDEAENPTHDRMTGRIASNRVRDLFQDRHVKSLLLFPADYKLPDDPDQPVKVQIELAPVHSMQQQRLLYEQARERLQLLGFRDGFLYDHRHFSRLVGYIPSSEVMTLFRDLRIQPEGWLTPVTPLQALPLPLRNISPIVIAEVLVEPEGVAPIKEFVAAPPVPKPLEKVAPEVRALLAVEDEAAKPRRLEIVLVNTPEPGSGRWLSGIKYAAPEITIEGRMGPYVTVLVAPAKAPAIAADPFVSLVRVPPSGSPVPLPAGDIKDANRTALRASGLEELHKQGRRGKNVRVAVISGDFRGYQEAVKAKRLPKNTRLLDMTAERNPDIQPEPYPEDGIKEGYGTQCAQTVALAAPECDLLLIRVDPAALYQMGTIGRSINQEQFGIEALEVRRNELEKENQRLTDIWQEVISERNILLQQFGDDDESKKKRQEHELTVKKLKAEETAYDQRLARYLQYLRDLRELRRLQVVVSTINWHDGYVTDGSNPLTRYLDDQPFRSTLWFQAAGETRGQVWTGLFRDEDGNGVMEFAEAPRVATRGLAAARGLPPQRWSREFNFIGWQPFQGARQVDLPEKATVRIAFQWTEAHDPAGHRQGIDLYREPLAQLRLMLLRQRDPTGQKVGADEMELVALSPGPALRVFNRAESATYELVLEYTVEGPGPYALYVEGRPLTSSRAPSRPTSKERIGEMWPRIFLNVTTPEARLIGRPVFADFASDEGTIGIPGDGQSMFTVGAADAANQPRPTTALGPALGLELLAKPNFFSYDGLPIGGAAARGSGIAASFAGGLAASVLSGGATPDGLRLFMSDRPEGILRVPRREAGRMPAAK